MHDYSYIHSVIINMKIICPVCKGKGHILDMAVMIFVPVISWLVAAIEHDDEESSTRKKCGRCDGNGFIQN